jgi:hypothetical protein
LATLIEWLSTLPHCLLYGRPLLGAFHLAGDVATFAAYMLIPFAIEKVRRVKELPFNGLAVLFAAFIGLCGFGHLLTSIATVTGSLPVYWVEGINKALTGVVSLATAAYMIKLIPEIIKIPTPDQWQELKKLVDQYREAERWRLFGKPDKEKVSWEFWDPANKPPEIGEKE